MSSLRKYGSSTIRQVSEAGKRLRQMFSSPIELSRGNSSSLHMRYNKRSGTKHEDITFDPDDVIRVYDRINALLPRLDRSWVPTRFITTLASWSNFSGLQQPK
ncbi:hypothetical protein BDR06DRAFT_782444 [Suillus hirtellus]|nr:hypothetical protein BDR06DRAFT_782444 [Suillus hirtellus]